MSKLKDYLLEQSQASPEALRRRLMVQSIAEYYIETMTLREALASLEEQFVKQLDNMPTHVLQSEYAKIFER